MSAEKAPPSDSDVNKLCTALLQAKANSSYVEVMALVAEDGLRALAALAGKAINSEWTLVGGNPRIRESFDAVVSGINLRVSSFREPTAADWSARAEAAAQDAAKARGLSVVK